MALPEKRRVAGLRPTYQEPRSRAFFLELLLNLLIFAVCAVIALQVFAQSKLVTDESNALTHLTLEARDLAGHYRVTSGEVSELLSGASGEARSGFGELSSNGAVVYYYNSSFELTQAADARYRMVLTPVASTSDLVKAVEIAAYAGEETLFSFEVAHYQARGSR